MVSFLFSAYFGGHFCYHSNDKSKSNLRLLHFGYCSNKPLMLRSSNLFQEGDKQIKSWFQYGVDLKKAKTLNLLFKRLKPQALFSTKIAIFLQ